MKHPFTLILLAGALHCASASAQNASGSDSVAVLAAKELLTAMNYREMTGKVMTQFETVMPENLRGVLASKVSGDPAMSEDQKRKALVKLEEQMPRFRREMHNLLSDSAMLDDMFGSMVQAYAEMYTTDELHQLTDFYRSPLGQKVLANIPRLAAEGTQVGTRMVARRMESFAAVELQRIVEK